MKRNILQVQWVSPNPGIETGDITFYCHCEHLKGAPQSHEKDEIASLRSQ